MAEKTAEQIRARKIAMAQARAKAESENGDEEIVATESPVEIIKQTTPLPNSTTSMMVKPITPVETNAPPKSALESGVEILGYGMGIPTRALGAASGQIPGLDKLVGHEDGKTFLQDLQDPKTHIFKKVKEYVDKSDMPGLAKFTANLGLDIGGDPQTLLGISSLIKAGAEGLKAAPSDLAAEVISKGQGIISKSHVNERALKTLASPGGKEALKTAYEALPENAKKLNDVIYNPGSYMQEHEAVIKPILSQVEDINPKSVIDVLKKNIIKKNVLLPEEKAFNASLKQHIDALEGNYAPVENQIERQVKTGRFDPFTDEEILKSEKIGGNRKLLGGNRYRDMRIELDQEPNWEGVITDNLKQKWNKAFQEARTVAKNELINATPDKYRSEMVKYADKYDAISRMKKIISKNPDIADLKAPGSLINIGKVNLKDVEVRNALQNLDKHFGLKGKDSLYEKAKLAVDAEALAKKGSEKFELPTMTQVSAAVLRTINAIKTVSKAGLKIGAIGTAPLARTITSLSPDKQEAAYKAADKFNKAKNREQKKEAQAEFDSVFTQKEE